MTRHVPRSARWSRFGPNEHRAAFGRVVFRAGSWHAEVSYQLTAALDQTPELPQTWDLGGFKRPRNAMMAVEDKVRELERKHAGVMFLDTTQGGAAYRALER